MNKRMDMLSERPITICTIVKTRAIPGVSNLASVLHHKETKKNVRALISFTLQRNNYAPTCTEDDFWAIRCSQLVQVA